MVNEKIVMGARGTAQAWSDRLRIFQTKIISFLLS
jgi:hypothetical protein